MNNKQLINENHTEPKISSRIYAFLLDALFLFLGGILVLYAFCFPISNANNEYIEAVKSKDLQYTEIINLGKESYLFKVDDQGVLYTNEMVAKYYMLQHIKLAYQYDNKIFDDIGYDETKINSKIEKASLTNDIFYNFYTNFIPNKLDSDGKLVLEVSDYKNYFYKEVLKINEQNSLFISANDAELPHFQVDKAKYLYEYIVQKKSYSTATKTYEETLNIFGGIYEQCGQLLKKYAPYQNAYDDYTDAFNFLNTWNFNCILISYFSTFGILFLIVPLFEKKQRTLGNKIFKIFKVNKKDSLNMVNLGLSVISQMLEFFFVFACLAICYSSKILINLSIFKIGQMSINISTFLLISIIFDIISISMIAFTYNRKSLNNYISMTSDKIEIISK